MLAWNVCGLSLSILRCDFCLNRFYLVILKTTNLVYFILTLFRLGFFGQSVTGGVGGGSSDPPSVSLEPIMLGS